MSNEKVNVNQFDEWLKDDSDIAALVVRQWLESVEGEDAVIFPPTYPIDQNKAGYNIDYFDDESSVCLIDSVGSQANRMEPTFKRESFRNLVPQITIKAGDKEVNLLDAGHRAGDAIARFAGTLEDEADGDVKPLAEQLWEAFKAWQEHGDAELLARIAPTSIIFGAWDSRATQAKLPRIVRSVVRAYNVKEYTRSAQFNTPLHYVDEGLVDEALDKGEGEKNPLSQEGFRHSPATGGHGGVEVVGEIRRDASINLVALRSLGVTAKEREEPEDTEKRVLGLRRYILGLAMIALTQRNDQQFNLREGCLLRIAKSSKWQTVPFEGERKDRPLDLQVVQEYATAVAKNFGVQQFGKSFVFDNKKAEKWLKLKKDERDKRRRQGPAITQEL